MPNSKISRYFPNDSAFAYETHALNFLRQRDQSPIGAKIVAQWSSSLNKGSCVLELACGAGFPISQVLHAVGLRMWAVDSSPTLLATFKNRFPTTPVQCAKVQESDFFGRNFDAVVAVGLLFLLPEAEQKELISKVANTLVRGGRFLFTAPLEMGGWRDLSTGIACWSLGQVAYQACLIDAGFRIFATYLDEGGNNYYDAERLA